MRLKKALWILPPVLLALFISGRKYSVESGGYDLSPFRRDAGLTSVPDDLRGLVASNRQAVRSILAQKRGRGLRFVIIGDTVSNDNAVFKGFLGEIAALEPRPSFIVHLGDRASSPIVESYGAYFKDIRNAPCPILHVNGNHDLREEGERISRAFFGDRDFFFDRGDMRFIFMDDNPERGRRGKHGRFSPSQLAWLEDKLKAGHPARKFFFAHVPPQAPFKDIDPGPAALFTPPLDNEKDFLDLLARYHVVLAAFGHRHVYASRVYDGVLMAITGGGGQNNLFEPQVDVPRFTKKNHYAVVDIPDSTSSGPLEGILSCVGRDHETLSILPFSQPALIAGAAGGPVVIGPSPAPPSVLFRGGAIPYRTRTTESSRTP